MKNWIWNIQNRCIGELCVGRAFEPDGRFLLLERLEDEYWDTYSIIDSFGGQVVVLNGIIKAVQTGSECQLNGQNLIGMEASSLGPLLPFPISEDKDHTFFNEEEGFRAYTAKGMIGYVVVHGWKEGPDGKFS